MSRMFRRHGFSVSELIIAIGIVGCIVAIGVVLASFPAISVLNVEAKQAKLSAALKSVTKSIVSGEHGVATTTVCDAVTMRDIYAAKLEGSQVIDDVEVNGQSLPALQVKNVGILAFEASDTCEIDWNNSTATDAPFVVYSSLDGEEEISVPAKVSASKKSSSSGILTKNTLAFAVTPSGGETVYAATTPTTPTLLAAAPASKAITSNTTASCKVGDNYSYVSATCKNEDGSGLDVKFYQMINESSCQITYCPGNGYDNAGQLITTGQVNLRCKLGTGNAAQCSCPEGKEYWATRYTIANSNLSGICLESCAELNMVETFPGSKECDCPTGTNWDKDAGKCITPGTCPEDYQKWDEINAQCICKTEDELLDMDPYYFADCEVYDNTKINDGCKRIAANWEKPNGQCVCPIPFTQDGKNCTCVNPRTQTGNVCACDITKVTLAEDEIFVNDDYNPTCKEKCDTDNFYYPNSTKTECIQILPDCSCLEEWDATQKKCVCNEDITLAELQQCEDLQAGNIFDATAPECQKDCGPKMAPDNTYKTCQCSLLQMTTQYSSPEMKFDPTSPTCESACPENQQRDTQDPVACVCKPLSQLNLADNEIYNPNLSSCVYTCKDGAVANSTHTACIGGCLEQYNYETEQLECIPNPSDAVTKECLAGTNFISAPTATECKVECSTLTSPDDVHKACPCDATKVASALNQPENLNKIYDLDNAPACMMACQGQTFPNTDRQSCRPVDCLYETTDNITQHCIANPSDDLTRTCLANTNSVSDPSAATCKVDCTGLTSPDNAHKACPCDTVKVSTELAKSENANKVYDLGNAPVCIKACTGQTFPNTDRMSCRPVDCLYETTDNVTQHCIANPTDAQTTACLAGTNYKSNPSFAGCKEDCGVKRAPNNVYKTCECSIEKMATQYSSAEMKFDPTSATCESACPENQQRDAQNPAICVCKPASALTYAANEIYMPSSATCKYTCKDGAVANETHTACVGSCLKEYNYETERFECIQNPSDELTARCLAGTNFVSDPSLPECMIECNPLTSPNAAHKFCPCNQAKVAVALTQPENLNKIYDLDHAPACMKACTGQTIPQTDRINCRPVDCLYETTDNATQHCIPNPTDEVTTFCLQGTNYKSNPSLPECKEDCGNRRVPNNVYKVCECNIQKMADKYSSNNMKYDPYAATCESACPSSFTVRDPQNVQTCKCPSTRPSNATLPIQAGYYFNPASTVISGTYACQSACPTNAAQITAWISAHGASFTGNKTVYDATKPFCVGSCTGNYVASADKTSCICGLNNNSCGVGTYYDAASCSCKPCTVGNYCPGGTQPIKCPCGTYGATTGLSTSACSGLCQAGYRCPEGSTSPKAVACTAGQTCPAGTCTPGTCNVPFTSTSPYTSCNACMSEADIRKANPNYYGANEAWSNDIALACKTCKSNMVYNAQGQCVCPADKPYWNGSSCQACKLWGNLYFARQEKDNPSCTLYNHMNGSLNSGCFKEIKRNPDPGMAHAASLLSNADKNRTFGNGVYAYMVAVSQDGKSASVVGVFTARTWYNTFPADLSSVSTNKHAQAGGTCQQMCGNNSECINTCNELTGKVTSNTMFNSCKYAVNNQFYGNSYGDADELCTGGKITLQNGCVYNVGALMRRVTSPLVLDLKGDGFKYTSAEGGVMFDLDNDGNIEQTAWTEPQSEFDNAFLVLDKNNNGQVDNGGELFGDQNGAENGFLELAKYDANGDGVINADDEIFNQLLLWVDFNKNGKVDYTNGTTEELKTLPEAGVTELSVSFEIVKDKKGNILKDAFGNITGFIGSFKMMIEDAAGKLVEVVRTMMDVFFTSL